MLFLLQLNFYNNFEKCSYVKSLFQTAAFMLLPRYGKIIVSGVIGKQRDRKRGRESEINKHDRKH